MSNQSYSSTRTFAARVGRQRMSIAQAEVRLFSYHREAVNVAPVDTCGQNVRTFTTHSQALPDFGPWAIAYVNGKPVNSPSYEAHAFRCIPGIKPRKLHVIRYSA